MNVCLGDVQQPGDLRASFQESRIRSVDPIDDQIEQRFLLLRHARQSFVLRNPKRQLVEVRYRVG